MIYINNNPERLHQLADNWRSKLRKFLTERKCYRSIKITGSKKKKRIAFVNYQDKIEDIIKRSKLTANEKEKCRSRINDFYAQLNQYVLAEEDQLKAFHDEYKISVRENSAPECAKAHALLSKIFIALYEDFTKSIPIFDKDDVDRKKYQKIPIAYYFFDKLNVRTCPYCNRGYTFTKYEKGCKTRPEYDHFYDKADNPLLAVSFYNLVPSCHTCNHIKLTKEIGINPYFSGFHSKFKVSKHDSKLPIMAEKDLTQDQLIIDFDNPTAAEQLNIDNLGLGDLYKMHADYAMELIEKARIYRGSMMEDLASTFQKAGCTPQQAFEFIWGKNLEDANHINRPLSKLTRDILEQLDIHVDDNL